MLSKCANPSCSAKLQYLRDGKVYRVDAASQRDNQPTIGREALAASRGQIIRHSAASGEESRPEYFWLCGTCAHEMTLALCESTVVLLPIRKAVVAEMARQAAAS